MKPYLLILFCCILRFPNPLFAQGDAKVFFEYRCVPTSTNDYAIEINFDKFVLRTTDKKADKKGERIIKVDSSRYAHLFDSKERETLESIIRINKLDSVALYQERRTEWGSLWKIRIERNSITYQVDLPNYNNPGLESLIRFIMCIIPKKERPPFECKGCN